METGNSGLIGLYETRDNLNAMKSYYRSEYKKLLDKEKKADSDFFHNKWKVRFGSFIARVGLTFNTRGHIGAISRLGTHAISFIAQKVLQLKNKRDKKKYQKQRDQLTADFINQEGNFEQFNILNKTQIEEIEYVENKGFSK